MEIEVVNWELVARTFTLSHSAPVSAPMSYRPLVERATAVMTRRSESTRSRPVRRHGCGCAHPFMRHFVLAEFS